MAKLKPWYQVVTPREDLRENKGLDASEFAVHLDQIRDGRAPKDYIDPARFFERTHLTNSLLDLASQTVKRLSGIQVETSAVFNMATQFGGGKSHSLTALYHLAKHGERAKSWHGVDRILRQANLQTLPQAEVAVFVGTEYDPLTGRGGNGEPIRKTIWGEIAWQLGGEKSFTAVSEHDAKGVAPGGDVIRMMLPDRPCLILLDELLNYASRGRHLGARDQLVNFLQNLCEEARVRKGLVVCVSVPKSVDLEMNPDDVRDYHALKMMLDRVGKAIMMSVDREIAEIIRLRLFDWNGMPDEGRKTAAAYAEWTIEHGAELSGFDADTIRERFQSAYPFHPAMLSVFERKWASLPRFQRTRGILRLLALWVAHNYQEEHRKASGEPLITVGLAPLQDRTFRAAMFEQLGSDSLEIPVTTDIGGKTDAHAIRLDKEADDAIKKAQLHRKVATAVFFESNGGMSQAKAEATVPEIKTAVFGPDTNMVDLDNVLEGLATTCYYLNWDRNRYRFGLSPNLNQILVNRRGAVPAKAIDERIRKQTEELFGKHSKDLSTPLGRATKEIVRKYSPQRSNDVPNHAGLTLVVFGLDLTANEKKTVEWMESIVRDCGASGRTYKSALIFAVPDAGNVVREAARNALAWEDIEDDEDTKKRIDEGQKNLLSRNLKNAQRDLDEAIFRTYRFVYLLGKDNKLREVPLGQITSSSAGSIVELILRELQRCEEITEGISPAKLIKYWPPALVEWSTKAVRDAFYSSPQLSRLLNPDSIKRTISDGVTQRLLGYASKDAGGRLRLEKFEESFQDAEVEISDDMFVLKADEAQKLQEPPRLTILSIRPEHVVLKPGEQAAFACSALDQYGHPFAAPAVTWSVSAGSITPEGVYTAGTTGGLHSVHATAGDREATAQVRVRTDQSGPDERDDEKYVEMPGKRMIRWRGTVPPQKWMNFYTRVLTRFAGSPDLKLEVSFEVAVERDQAQSKADETRAGLKELGLDDTAALS
jgi:predicted AAA+ superfamily ATPase